MAELLLTTLGVATVVLVGVVGFLFGAGKLRAVTPL